MLISEIQECLYQNAFIADEGYMKPNIQTMEQIKTSPPMDLTNPGARLEIGEGENKEHKGEYYDYVVCKPLNTHNDIVKTNADFDLWDI